MTSEVDTSALRAMATAEAASGNHEYAALVRGAADELDALRQRVAELEIDRNAALHECQPYIGASNAAGALAHNVTMLLRPRATGDEGGGR